MKEAPKTLKAKGKQLWRDVLAGWDVQAEQLVLLQDLCECQDRISELSGILRKEGQLSLDRFGISRPHPATLILKGEVGNFTRLYKALALETPGGSDLRPGRPDGFSPEEKSNA
jgi:hypothetical protein